MNPGFNMALAALVAGSVFVTDAVSPEWAEAARSSGRMGGHTIESNAASTSARSSGRMGGSSFRSAPRAAPRAAAGQSRQAPPPQVMRGGMGYGYGMPMFMPFSPFGFSPFGFGFGFGGLGFIFNILLFLWIANFFVSLVSSMAANNNQARDDDDFQPPRY